LVNAFLSCFEVNGAEVKTTLLVSTGLMCFTTSFILSSIPLLSAVNFLSFSFLVSIVQIYRFFQISPCQLAYAIEVKANLARISNSRDFQQQLFYPSPCLRTIPLGARLQRVPLLILSCQPSNILSCWNNNLPLVCHPIFDLYSFKSFKV